MTAESRVCPCGTKAPGLWPAGWLIRPIASYVAGAGATMVTGEVALCPDCARQLREKEQG